VFFELAEALGYPQEKTTLVLNRVDRRLGLRPEDIESSIKHPISALFTLDEFTATQAVNRGIPLVQGNRNTALAREIITLAARLKEELTPVEVPTRVQPQRGGFIKRLFK